MSTPQTERLAAEIHEVYRATARDNGWIMRPEVDVPYHKLSSEAQELDRALAKWHLERVRGVFEDLGDILEFLADEDTLEAAKRINQILDGEEEDTG